MCLFLYTPCVWCAVDLGDLSYHVSDDDFGIQRTYNSRRVREGLFGFGWCSVIETQLVFGPDGKPNILTCDGILKTHDAQTMPRIGSEWIWNSGPGRWPIYKFSADGKLRFLGAKLNQGYVVIWGEHSVVLQQTAASTYNQIVFHFAKRKSLASTVEKVTASQGNIFERISKMEILSNDRSRSFDYQNGLLTKIQDAATGHSQFTYNLERNMSLLTGPGRMRRQILYDKNNDEIKEVKREDGCFEFYERPKNTEAARARLICQSPALLKPELVKEEWG